MVIGKSPAANLKQQPSPDLEHFNKQNTIKIYCRELYFVCWGREKFGLVLKLRSVCWCSVKMLLLVGLDRKKHHFRHLSSGLGFSPSPKELAKNYHISKMVRKRLLYKGTPGQ